MQTCTAEYARLSATLHGVRCDGNPFITITNPADLDNWTLPVIEATLVIGLFACLVHAVRWYRSQHDASNLVVWCSGILALLVVEPIAYFPQWFGIEDELGLTFAHNLFTVQFLYDRLPLYIIAMYPVYLYVAYTLVQRTGIFSRNNIFVSAACVAFVFHCLYQVVDGLGPQLKWWVWNQEVSTAHPSLSGIPLLNMSAFSVMLPFGIALVTRWLCTIPHRGGWYIVRDVVVTSVLVWPVLFVGSIPPTIVDLLGGSLLVGRAVSAWAYVAILAIITAVAFYRAYRARRTDPAALPEALAREWFPVICCVIYLLVAAVLWISALPEYVAAVDGVAPSGGRIGPLPYALAAYVTSVLLVIGSSIGVRRRQPDRVAEHHADHERVGPRHQTSSTA